MEWSWMPAAVIAMTGATLYLAQIFNVRKLLFRDWSLCTWWWCFVVSNGVSAGIYHQWVQTLGLLSDLGPLQASFTLGFSYITIKRLGFYAISSIEIQSFVGTSLIYGPIKAVALKRINLAVRRTRVEQAKKDGRGTSVSCLAAEVQAHVWHDALLRSEEKKMILLWIQAVIAQPLDDEQKKMLLYSYLTSGVLQPLPPEASVQAQERGGSQLVI